MEVFQDCHDSQQQACRSHTLGELQLACCLNVLLCNVLRLSERGD